MTRTLVASLRRAHDLLPRYRVRASRLLQACDLPAIRQAVETLQSGDGLTARAAVAETLRQVDEMETI